ncbi:glycosyltransferase family 4 protein [Microbacterium gilvum]|uniref:D-inositol 3-phosphate glycosyltransferase n=1 Tax=Microbacterium gilvum TaxID=1336204 RepID=A0ABP9AG55_9MICO
MSSPEDARRPVRRRWLIATTEYAGLTPYTGGIGRHYAALAPALVDLGADVDLAVFADGPPARADLRGVRLVAYRRTDGVDRTALLHRRARELRRIHAAGRYDRVFLPEWSALGSLLPRSAPLLTNLATGMRLANEVSGLRLRDLPAASRLPVAAQMAAERRQITRSAGLVAISHAMLAWTRRAYRADAPSVVVRNCIDVAGVHRAAERSPLPGGWPGGCDPILLFLGRSERRKGVVDAFAAFARVHGRFPRARLVLAGAGGDARFEPRRADLLDMLPPSARDLVHWLGHVPGDELYAAIRASDAVLCPSLWEGFGNVALEAKAIGKAVVATSGSGFDDFCSDGVDSLLVPPGAPAALAHAVERLLDDPATAARLAAAGRAGAGRFAPRPVARDLIAAADELLPSARSLRRAPSPSPRA